MSFKRVIDAWHDAAIDLKLKIQSPFILMTADNKQVQFELLIENFGSNLGTLVLSMDSYDSSQFKIAKESGYYCSAENPDSHSVYEKQAFIDILNDWGYFGEESKKPEWYTGQPWA